MSKSSFSSFYKYDSSDGTDWRKDLEAIEMFGELTSNLDPEFIVCDGDLNNAYPVVKDPADDPAFKPVYRPPQVAYPYRYRIK